MAVVDYDAHGPEPNGASLFRQLLSDRPVVFEDAIIEQTQSGGYHCYYKGIEGSASKAERWTTTCIMLCNTLPPVRQEQRWRFN